jgi:hypothetical protein
MKTYAVILRESSETYFETTIAVELLEVMYNVQDMTEYLIYIYEGDNKSDLRAIHHCLDYESIFTII